MTPLKKTLPEGATKGNHQKRESLKGCVGLRDYYKNGFCIPLWSDMELGVFPSSGERGVSPEQGPGVDYDAADGYSKCYFHRPAQWEHVFNKEKYAHIKLGSPWLVRCDEDVKFHLGPPAWEFYRIDKRCHILSGVVEFKYQTTSNVNLMIEREAEPYYFLLEAGTPMLHGIPLSERSVKVYTHLLEDDEYFRLERENNRCFYHNTYLKSKTLLKKMGK